MSDNTAKNYEIKRTVIETYYIEAKSKKEALQIIGEIGDPATVRVKSETVKLKR